MERGKRYLLSDVSLFRLQIVMGIGTGLSAQKPANVLARIPFVMVRKVVNLDLMRIQKFVEVSLIFFCINLTAQHL